MNPESTLEIIEEEILDQRSGLMNVGGNKEIYTKILSIFLEENQNTVVDLQKAVDTNDFDEAVQIVHKIKGSCGIVGATKLYQNTIKLQQALQNRDQSDIKTYYPEFNHLLNNVLAQIQKLL